MIVHGAALRFIEAQRKPAHELPIPGEAFRALMQQGAADYKAYKAAQAAQKK